LGIYRGGENMNNFNDKPDFIELEHSIMKFWEENQCFRKLKVKNKDKKPFRFLDGPITANNPMGIHHAWGRTTKDIFLKYKAMQGHSCLYRNGFDGQGLWVEVEVEKELGFKNKMDIEHFGMDNFTEKCVERVEKFSKVITEQSKRLGQWMDWENSYYTNTDENITGIWSFLKKCDENKWIKQAHRPMPWCPRCGTSLSEHEMTGSYKEIEHTTVFFKLPLKEKPWDILVWTTTPWTLSANVALAVNAEIDYCVVDYEGDRPLLLAKNALKFIKGKKTILQYVKGSELNGFEYETCFPALPVQKELQHKIVLWDMVSSEDGSGVVHIAPGCGAEDFELGQSLGLTSICPVDEYGSFLEGYDWLTGLKVSEAPEVIFSKLQEQGKLFMTHSHTHSYPVCWRCKTEVIFRLVKEWHICTEEIKPKLLEAASAVKWEPEHVGKRMQNWLENMGDWSISRKRFYGLPLPFYPCKKCGKVTVVGSKEELRRLGGSKVDELKELHRPWIDDIKIRCPHCGGEVERISEVGDVWLDAGITPFTTLGYFSDRDKWEKQFPAEWVTEMVEQVRLWFYSLLFMSVTLTGKAPYERVLAYSSVIAEDGTKFSKTGFMIKFHEAAEKIGSDAIRYLFAGSNASSEVRFGYNLGEEARRKLLAFWNVYSFFMTYATIEKPEIKGFNPAGKLEISDRWLLSRTDSFIKETTSSLENYKTSEVIKAFESFTEDLSNWYVRINRRRFWKQGQDENKQAAYWCLYEALKAAVQIMAPIIPFVTEHMWQNMVRVFQNSSEESVHLSNWPKPLKLEDSGILKEMDTARKLVALALKLRNEKQLKVKQPLSTMFINAEADNETVINNMRNIIRDELNIKEIVFLKDFNSLKKRYLILNFKNAGAELKEKVNEVKKLLEECNEGEMAEIIKQFDSGASIKIPKWNKALDSKLFLEKGSYDENYAVGSDGNTEIALLLTLNEELVLEGLYRELLRKCQLLRKEAGLRVEQKIVLGIKSNSDRINEIIKRYGKNICEETLALELVEAVECPLITEKVDIDEGITVLQISDKPIF
jgi:isoleucyl-tRNA synthetase